MNIELEKAESIIASVKSIFKKKQQDFWDELSEEQQNVINESLEQYEKGDFSSFDDFIKPHL